MNRVYDLLVSLGYPKGKVDLLHRHRALLIIVLALLAWVPVIAVGWLIFRSLGG